MHTKCTAWHFAGLKLRGLWFLLTKLLALENTNTKTKVKRLSGEAWAPCPALGLPHQPPVPPHMGSWLLLTQKACGFPKCITFLPLSSQISQVPPCPAWHAHSIPVSYGWDAHTGGPLREVDAPPAKAHIHVWIQTGIVWILRRLRGSMHLTFRGHLGYHLTGAPGSRRPGGAGHPSFSGLIFGMRSLEGYTMRNPPRPLLQPSTAPDPVFTSG